MSKNKNEVKLGYDDITIVPAKVSNIISRSQCDCTDKYDMLPIFAAPMDTVVNKETFQEFAENGIYPVIPRTETLDDRLKFVLSMIKGDHRVSETFVAFSLYEAIDIFCYAREDAYSKELDDKILSIRSYLENSLFSCECNICIDLANGHMSCLLEAIKAIKTHHGNKVTIMSGNIANPKTYEEYEKAGCDFVRCNIGSGGCCTTASNVGCFYPTFSLLKETWEIKQKIGGKCKIIADGGIKGFRDVQKALLYADYVMIGGLFNKAIDSAGTPVYGKSYWNIFGKKVVNPFKTLFTYGRKVKSEDYEKVLKKIKKGKLDVWKETYGMSTKKAQSKMNPGTRLKTSEGLVKKQKVEYSLKQWVENEKDYLKSAMSYTNSRTLEEYQDSEWVQVNYRAYNN